MGESNDNEVLIEVRLRERIDELERRVRRLTPLANQAAMLKRQLVKYEEALAIAAAAVPACTLQHAEFRLRFVWTGEVVAAMFKDLLLGLPDQPRAGRATVPIGGSYARLLARLNVPASAVVNIKRRDLSATLKVPDLALQKALEVSPETSGMTLVTRDGVAFLATHAPKFHDWLVRKGFKEAGEHIAAVLAANGRGVK